MSTSLPSPPVRELGLGGHLEILAGVADRLDEKTFARIARHDRGAGVAAFQETGHRVQQQVPTKLLGLAAVATVAMLDE
jgi:hypothetical protein